MSKPVCLSTGPMMPLVTDALEAEFETHWLNRASDPKALLAEISPRVEMIATGAHTFVRTTDEMMAAMPKLSINPNFGVGYDSIDVAAAARRGVIISNTPDVLNEEVADTALGLLLNTVREFGRAETFMRAGRWPIEGDYPLTKASLRDRSVGMVGFGRIGKAIARRIEAFGLPVSYFARSEQKGVPQRYYASLVELAKAVDTLIVITPGGPATQNLINAEVLAALGPRGILINMARGSVVDEPALIAALRAGTIQAAGLDVFWNEPKVNPELFELPNLTVFPHVGSLTELTRGKMGQLVVDNLVCYKSRKPPLTPVPETPFKGW